MPTRPVVEHEVALPGCGVLAARGKLLDERKLAVIAVIKRARFTVRLANHRRKSAYTGAERFGEVDGLGRLPIEPG